MSRVPLPIAWRTAVYAVDGRVLSWRAKAVAGAISTHMDGNGRNVRPSVAMLAAETALSSRTVDTGLRELREAGFLVVERKGGGRKRPTRYRGVIPALEAGDLHPKAREYHARRAEFWPETTHVVQENHARGADKDVQEDVQYFSRRANARRNKNGGALKARPEHLYLDEAGQ